MCQENVRWGEFFRTEAISLHSSVEGTYGGCALVSVGKLTLEEKSKKIPMFDCFVAKEKA